MATHGKNRTRTKPNEAKGRVRHGRPKVCVFCVEHVPWVDYKDTNLLRRFITDRGKIKARTNTGTCAQHQRDVSIAIKTARELAMLPYVVRMLAADKSSGRRGGGSGRLGDRTPSAKAAPTPPSNGEGGPAEAREPEGMTADADVTGVPDLSSGGELQVR
jgi:small subunit ribosomal protein S18